MKKKEKVVDLGKYGFLIDVSQIKEYSNDDTIFLNKSAAEALLLAKKQLPESYNFVIKDGLRTLQIQKKIVELEEKELKKSHPNNWQELLDKYTGGYKELKETKISFMNHRSGYAVDLSLSKSGKEVDIGGVDLSDRDRIDFFDNKENINPGDLIIKNNRDILRQVLRKVGFKPYPLEWWHWGYSGDN